MDGSRVQTVDLYDGETFLGVAVVDENGVWEKKVSGLEEGSHRLIAKLGNWESDTWGLSVRKPLTLLAPRVREVYQDSVSGNSLNLVKPITAATVVVDYPGMQLGDLVTIEWQGQTTLSETKTAGTSVIEFIVPYHHVQSSIGSSVSVRYLVTPVHQTEKILSPELVFAVIDSPLKGTATQSNGATTRFYDCTHAAGEIVVNDSMPIGTVLGQTPEVLATNTWSITLNGVTSRFAINDMGPQPASTSELYPSHVQGVGIRVSYRGRFLIAGPEDLPGGTSGINGQRGAVEFVKTGPVIPGTIAAGELVTWTYGTNRRKYVSYRLTAPVRIVTS